MGFNWPINTTGRGIHSKSATVPNAAKGKRQFCTQREKCV